MLPNWFMLGMLLTCHLLMARLDHTAEMSFMQSVCVDLLAYSLADLLVELNQQMCSLSCSICALHSTVINQCLVPIMVLRCVSLNIACSICLTGNAGKSFSQLSAVF